MEICVTRFNNKTFQENENYKNNTNIIGTIYGSPTKISDKILPDTSILVLEMNNSTNRIEGIGYIKNKIFINEKKVKIYNDNNYNRYIYKSNIRIDKKNFSKYEKYFIEKLENLLFKSYNHCKRGHGIQSIPRFVKSYNDFDYKKFIYSMYYKRFVKIDISKLKIKN